MPTNFLNKVSAGAMAAALVLLPLGSSASETGGLGASPGANADPNSTPTVESLQGVIDSLTDLVEVLQERLDELNERVDKAAGEEDGDKEEETGSNDSGSGSSGSASGEKSGSFVGSLSDLIGSLFSLNSVLGGGGGGGGAGGGLGGALGGALGSSIGNSLGGGLGGAIGGALGSAVGGSIASSNFPFSGRIIQAVECDCDQETVLVYIQPSTGGGGTGGSCGLGTCPASQSGGNVSSISTILVKKGALVSTNVRSVLELKQAGLYVVGNTLSQSPVPCMKQSGNQCQVVGAGVPALVLHRSFSGSGGAGQTSSSQGLVPPTPAPSPAPSGGCSGGFCPIR